MITQNENYNGLNVTFNVTEDCNLKCKYCVPAGTLVMTPGYGEVPIESVKVGNTLLGFDEYSSGGKHRKVREAVVTEVMSHVDQVFTLKTRDGRALTVTKNHPLLNTRGSSGHSWKPAGAYKVGENIRVVPQVQSLSVDVTSESYATGYFIGMMLGDGTHGKYKDKHGYAMYKVRVALIDPDGIDRMELVCARLGIELYRGPFQMGARQVEALFGNKRSVYEKVVDIVAQSFRRTRTLSYFQGFLAGIYDAEGSISASGTIRISNKDEEILSEIEDGLTALHIAYVREVPRTNGVSCIRILSPNDSLEWLRFIKSVCPAIGRKGVSNLLGKAVLTSDEIISIGPLKRERVYNIETTTRTYIANTVCVHNCYELDKRPNDLPLEYAQKFIDVLLTDPDPIGAIGTDMEWLLDQGLILDFIGGDALMRPYLVGSILDYFVFKSQVLKHKWANRWRASLSTNGTLFGEPGVKDFLLRYKENLSLGVSVDGCPEIHNLNRDNSLPAILEHWDWVVKYTGGVISTKATLNKDSIPYLYKSLKFLHESMGFTSINMNFIFEPMGETDLDLQELDRQYEKCIPYVLEHRNDLHWAMISQEFGTGTSMDASTIDKGWCGAGAMPCLGVNGKIYPCFRFMPHTMSSRALDFYVGDVWNGFTHKHRFEEVRKQTRRKISCTECNECPVESSCAWCIGGAFSEKGEFYRQTNICKVHKIQTKWAEVYWREYERLEGHRDYKPLVTCSGGTCAATD